MHIIIRKTQLLRIIIAKKLKQNTGPLQSKKYNCASVLCLSSEEMLYEHLLYMKTSKI